MMSRIEGVPAEHVEVGMSVVFEAHCAEDGEPVAVFLPERS